MDEHLAVFTSRKTVEGSFACELGMQCHSLQQGKDGKSQGLTERIDKS